MKRSHLLLIVPFLMISCSQMEQSGTSAGDEITITWTLYVNQQGSGVIQESVTGNVAIDHVNGDLLRISPIDSLHGIQTLLSMFPPEVWGKSTGKLEIPSIPEINFPGHARAAIYSMEARYERLMKEGKREEAELYRLVDPDDASVYSSAQIFNDNVICVCTEGPYRLFEILERKDLVMAGWEEVAMKKDAAGRWIPNPKLVGKDLSKPAVHLILYPMIRKQTFKGWKD